MNTMTSDIDGTVVVYGENNPPNWANGYELVSAGHPNPPVLSYIREAIDAGIDVHFVSARRASTATVTLRQLNALLDRRVLTSNVHCLPTDDWSPAFAFAHKVHHIKGLQASLHIGDEAIDREAAIAAGASFLFADTIARNWRDRLNAAGVQVIA